MRVDLCPSDLLEVHAGTAPSSRAPETYCPQSSANLGLADGFHFSITFQTAFPNGVGPIIITPASVPASTTGAAWYETISLASKTGFTLTASVSNNVIG